jgi:thiol-disulfide isomerase/thioredoxin
MRLRTGAEMRLRILVLTLVAVLLAGCAGTSRPAGTAASSPPATTTVDGAGVPADLSWTATTVDGKKFSGTSLLGKPALVWFWAPWCPICQSEIPEVKRVVKQYGGRVTVVGVGGLDKTPAIRRADEVLDGVVNLADEQQVVWLDFGIADQANYVVLDRTGHVAYNSSVSDGEDAMPEHLAKVAG